VFRPFAVDLSELNHLPLNGSQDWIDLSLIAPPWPIYTIDYYQYPNAHPRVLALSAALRVFVLQQLMAKLADCRRE
jgi:hypothetical protein